MKASNLLIAALIVGLLTIGFVFGRAMLDRRNTYIPPRLTGEIVSFPSGNLTLHGVIYKPKAAGPFPALLFNHGSSPGMNSNEAFERLGPMLAKHGWVMFAPYRRGQGLSKDAGLFIQDEMSTARRKGGSDAYYETMLRLLTTDHLDDQLAALSWLRNQSFVQPSRIAVAGNSFGGIETVLGAEKESYCAAIDASGGAETWTESPSLQDAMKRAVQNSRAPFFFFQAENDYNLSPTKILSAAAKDAGHIAEFKIYPPFGKSAAQGHSFAFLGTSVWFEDAFRFLERHCG